MLQTLVKHTTDGLHEAIEYRYNLFLARIDRFTSEELSILPGSAGNNCVLPVSGCTDRTQRKQKIFINKK